MHFSAFQDFQNEILFQYSKISYNNKVNFCELSDMYITFDVEFPKGELSAADKENIAKILNQDHTNKVYNGLGGFS